MRYEVRVRGGSIGIFATAEEALECVRAALAENPDDEPEIIDMQTGQAFEPLPDGQAMDDIAETSGS
jgi:hypothetical protein